MAAGRPPVRRKAFTVATLTEVAEFFGVSGPAVTKWTQGDDPMPGRKGSYDLAKIAQWRQRRGADNNNRSDELKAAEIRLKTAQAMALEMTNAETRRNLVAIDDVHQWAEMVVEVARETFSPVPETLAAIMPSAMRGFVFSESDRHIRDSLTAMKRRLETKDFLNDEPIE